MNNITTNIKICGFKKGARVCENLASKVKTEILRTDIETNVKKINKILPENTPVTVKFEQGAVTVDVPQNVSFDVVRQNIVVCAR